MNSHYDIHDNYLNDNFGLAPLSRKASQITEKASGTTGFVSCSFASDWHHVQMGWFTSSYCSCRSCIGQ